MQTNNTDDVRENLIKLSILKPVHTTLYQIQVIYNFINKIDDEIIDSTFDITKINDKDKKNFLTTLYKEFNLCFKILLFFAYYEKAQDLSMKYNIFTENEIRSEVMLEGKTWIDIYNTLYNYGYLDRIRALGKGDIYDKTSPDEKNMVNEYSKIYLKLVQPGKEDNYE